MSRFNSLMSTIDPIISDLELKEGRVMVKEDVNLYQAINKLLSLKKAEVDILNIYDEINDLIIEYAKMNFSATVKNETDLEFLLPIERGLSMMAEELKLNAVPLNFLNDTLNLIDAIVFITDNKGIIKHINNKVETIGYSKEELINISIYNVLQGLEKAFDISKIAKSIDITDKEFQLIDKNKTKSSTVLNIKSTKGTFDISDGFLFIIKKTVA